MTASTNTEMFVSGVRAIGDTLYACNTYGLGVSTDGGSTSTRKTTDNGLGSDTVNKVWAKWQHRHAATPGGLSKATVTNGTGVVLGSAAFTDPAGRTLSYSTTSASVGGGTVGVDAATGAYIFTPTAAQRAAATANTTDTFIITAFNGVNSTGQVVTVTVAAT